jgi:2-methylisocitrate lyase-like PEP mutase family enzyme
VTAYEIIVASRSKKLITIATAGGEVGMNSRGQAERFAGLHIKGSPLVLFNAWDAGSAKAVCEAGAPAIATSSWAVAAAQGYADGERIPMHLVEEIIARIVATVDIPVTVDFEGGYSDDDGTLARNVATLLDLGIIGINFEDRIVSGSGLHSVERQSRRIEALRRIADERGVPLFINARTDVFLAAEPGDDHSVLVEAAKARAAAYAQAGASGFFVPGLVSESLIEEIRKASTLPLNVMITKDLPSTARLAELGVARISYGPAPFIEAIEKLKAAASSVYAANKHTSK